MNWKLIVGVAAGILVLGGIAWAASRPAKTEKKAPKKGKKKSVKKDAKAVVKKAMKSPVVVSKLNDLKAALQTAAKEVKA